LHADAGATVNADGEFTGNLYVRGGFDPDFGAADLAAFISALRSEGISRIRGDVLLDVSMKDTARLGWGWCWDDNADTNPVLTPLPYEGKDQFAPRLAQQLRAAGISLTGRIRKGNLPRSGRTRLLCERSHSIDQLLQPMMKQSDNFYAEALFYQMAAHGGQPYATRKQAYAHICSLVERVGLSPQDYTFADGSGVSLYNYASPELFVRLLRHAYQTPDIYHHLLPSLPVAGVDGTLKKRMTEGSALRNVQAKTGTVTGISTLAGYATAPDGHRLCFSIMNSGQQRAAPARDFQNRVCQAMTRPW
ncbi:MAG: D-alanyl-D-alanine carboxypeptidase/D-alanyl-D-alanine-endopeptidase, partial [Alloprevotella sp.]|nr:D-alanyl-D-alanine carboxypeptidase/D-alanyl-D-alanine-endopeptidase [Alloprevotella sp.]